MSLKECYDKMGADYEDVLSRLRSEVLVRKFALKFLDDDSYEGSDGKRKRPGSISRRSYLKRCCPEFRIWTSL